MDRLETVMRGMGRPYEIIFADDGSRDRSLEILKGFVGREGVRVVELTRNYGQHPAIFAGFSVARGDIIVTIDADLQNPPEEIPKLVRAMEEGEYEVVGSIRAARHDTAFRRAASRVMSAMTRRITRVPLEDWGCMLRAYRRGVVDRMLDAQEYSTYIPALATLYAKRVGEVPVAHADRHGGQSKYNLWKLLNLEFDLMTSFSDYPLKLLLYLGLLLALAGVSFGVLLAVLRIVYGAEWGGYGVFTLFAVLFFFMGGIFFGLGVMGQYLGRVYHEVRRRPSYTIRRIHERTVSEGRPSPSSGRER
ncbi:MAG: glycosyltransferase [Deltaproteobacteria bacterium]|nr:glycosyltransferase [Deltaproteobacteria bacterium]